MKVECVATAMVIARWVLRLRNLPTSRYRKKRKRPRRQGRKRERWTRKASFFIMTLYLLLALATATQDKQSFRGETRHSSHLLLRILQLFILRNIHQNKILHLFLDLLLQHPSRPPPPHHHHHVRPRYYPYLGPHPPTTPLAQHTSANILFS